MKFYHFLILIISLNSCTSNDRNTNNDEALSVDNNAFFEVAKNAFEKRDINGCFILRDISADANLIYNEKRANEPFLPASTYKILNSMIALQCGVISDEKVVIAWDSVKRSVSAWNRDHNMESGIKNSVVWFYQELARRIGEQRMQYWVDTVGYGNKAIGKAIDSFWLVGDLRITPMEQVRFLENFINGKLPFNKDHISTVKRILTEDKGEGYTLRGKTGWADFGVPVGWYVGYLEYQGSTFIFVNNIEIRNNKDANARKEITKEVLGSMFNIELAI